jgi:hypothetical protein
MIKDLNEATIVMIEWYWPKNIHMDSWNRIESSVIAPHKYSQFIFDKETKAI